MRRLAAFLLIIALLSASVALAQTTPPPASTASKKFGVVIDAPRSAPAAPTAGATTTAAAAPPSNVATVYTYRGPGGSIALDERPPSEFNSALPKGWTSADYVGYFNTPRDSLPLIEQQAKFFKTLPAAAYEGRVVFRDAEGDVAIIQGTTTYWYTGDALTVRSPAEGGRFREYTYRVGPDGKYYYDLSITIDGMRAVQDTKTGEYRFIKQDGTLLGDEESVTFAQGHAEELFAQSYEPGEALSRLDTALAGAQAVVAREQELAQYRAVYEELGSYVWYAQQYGGMAGWSSLFFSDEFLANWRTSVNEFFCKTIILGGTDCWASKICGRYSDITPSRDGVLFSSVVGGAPQAVAHIEGQKSLPIPHGSETIHVYTVTFGIINTLDQSMTYNVQFKGPTRTANWWGTAQQLSEGGTASALGGAALIKASKHEYSEVCLEFSPHIKSFDGKEIDHKCNSFVQHAGGASAPYGAEANDTAAAQADQPAAPTTPGANV